MVAWLGWAQARLIFRQDVDGCHCGRTRGLAAEIPGQLFWLGILARHDKKWGNEEKDDEASETMMERAGCVDDLFMGKTPGQFLLITYRV